MVVQVVACALVSSVWAGAALARTAEDSASATITKTVVAKENYFSPKSVSISKGSSIKWTNKGYTSHTITSTTSAWSSKTLAPGQSFTRVFNKAGTFNYKCKFHFGMTGKVVVS